MNWDSLLSDDVDLSTELWKRKFLEIMEECVPQRDLKRRRNLHWLTKNIVQHMRKRNKKPTHFEKYKKVRNDVTMMLRAAKKNFFNSLTSANSKQFWKTVKLEQESIPALNQDIVNAVTDEEKSNMLNRYFSTCWNRSESPLTDPPDNDCVECDETCPDHLLCTMDELINGLDVWKANGPDGISARMLKATSNSIAPSLTNYPFLLATSLNYGRKLELCQFPNQLLSIVHLGTGLYRCYQFLASFSKIISIY